MRKVIKIKESELIRLVSKVINEQKKIEQGLEKGLERLGIGTERTIGRGEQLFNRMEKELSSFQGTEKGLKRFFRPDQIKFMSKLPNEIKFELDDFLKKIKNPNWEVVSKNVGEYTSYDAMLIDRAGKMYDLRATQKAINNAIEGKDFDNLIKDIPEVLKDGTPFRKPLVDILNKM